MAVTAEKLTRHTYWLEVLAATGMAVLFYGAVWAAMNDRPVFTIIQSFLFGVNLRTFTKQAALRQMIAELAAQERRLRELTGRWP